MTMNERAIRPGVAAVIRDPQRRVLLHRRRVGGGWAPISGSIEFGEGVLDALAREVREETGLSVIVERCVGVYSDPAYQVVDYPDERQIHFVTSLFVCRAETSEVSGSDEGLAWEWFSPDALPDDLLPYARVWISDALDRDSSTRVR